MSASADATPGLEGITPLRRNRDFQLLWGAQAVSVLGSQTAKIAYPLLVLAMTGFLEGTAAVFFGVAQRAALPMIVQPSQRAGGPLSAGPAGAAQPAG